MIASLLPKRALKNNCLSYLVLSDVTMHLPMCVNQFEQSDNMTDQLSALAILSDHALPQAQQMLEQFYQTWRHNPLVLDKWFAIQAQSRLPNRFTTSKKHL